MTMDENLWNEGVVTGIKYRTYRIGRNNNNKKTPAKTKSWVKEETQYSGPLEEWI